MTPKRNLLLSLLFLFFCFSSFSQSDLLISGGNSVSSMVCANQKVFVWGNNTDGILGLGHNFTPVTQPEIVPFPQDQNIKQVSSGSGNHFVAVDCEGYAWAWGNNVYGQIGNGGTGNVVTSPTQVLASADIATENHTDDGFLSNVEAVYAGFYNSFAILKNGRLVSWGKNSMGANPWEDCSGQLGDGTTINRTSAVYVRNGATGLPLEGVVQIYSGDNVAYALVDPDGDGLGTVYSWGAGYYGTLGRNATGTANPASSNYVQSSYAFPVIGPDGAFTNITSISAGDVIGMALDAAGYVWTWGNGAWNNVTGNTTVNYAGSDPRRVIAGNTTGESNDGIYLLAKAIGGGQGFTMAVTVDHKPVAWGGSGDCNGGITGTGSIDAGIPPSYIEHAPGQVHNNVIAINRGDHFGFYVTSTNDVYAWGCNVDGQLGIGHITNQLRVVQFVPPLSCDMRDPAPFVSISSPEISVCQADIDYGVQLNSGFFISPEHAPKYEIKWYRNTLLLASGTAEQFIELTVTDTGHYTVEIDYTGTNNGCAIPDTAKGVVKVSIPEETFTTSTIKNCGGVCGENGAELHVTPKGASGTFAWFSSPTGPEFGRSNENTFVCVNTDTLQTINSAPAQWRVYVQDVSTQNVVLVTEDDNTASNPESVFGHSGTRSRLYFETKTDVKLTSVDVSFISNSPSSIAMVEIRLASNNGLIASAVTDPMGAMGVVTKTVNFNNIDLLPDRYYITLPSGTIQFYRNPGDAYKDYNYNGTTVFSLAGFDVDGYADFEIPAYRSWNFLLDNSSVCRYPVVIEECVCEYPEPYVGISPSSDTVVKSSDLSEGLLINSGFQVPQDNESLYQVSWFRNGTLLAVGTAETHSTYTVYSDGNYAVEVEFTGNEPGCTTGRKATASLNIIEEVVTSNPNKVNETGFQLNPNPTNSEVTIDFGNNSVAEIVDVVVMDLSGKVVLTYPKHDTSQKLILGKGLPQGMYSVRVLRNQQISVLNFIKM